jgi:multidrug efflux system outer membrane protein
MSQILRGSPSYRLAIVAELVFGLAACAPTMPPKPDVDVGLPPVFRIEAPAVLGSWKAAEPSDAIARGSWWQQLGDTDLSALIEAALATNPSLQVAQARVRQAQNQIAILAADGAPQASLGFGPSRQRPSPAALGLDPGTATPVRTVWRVPVSLAWEIDLAGRVQKGVNAATLDAQSAAALMESSRLSLAAEVARQYFGLRGTQAEIQVLANLQVLREQTLRLTRRRLDAGDATRLDVARFELELAQGAAEIEQLRRIEQAAQIALAQLLAQPGFKLETQPASVWNRREILIVPAGLPSSLLERRLDIAASQRTMAAQYERIGIARAAFFPALRLSATLGFESRELQDMFQWSSRTWLLGPLFGGILSVPILDGGRNQANFERAQFALAESIEQYRSVVLGAFSEVEDALVAVRSLQAQREQLAAVQTSATQVQAQVESRFSGGLATSFERIDAQRALLAVQRQLVQVQAARLQASVQLIKALGGTW